MDWQRRTWGSTFALPKARLGFQVVMQWLMLEVRNELNGGKGLLWFSQQRELCNDCMGMFKK